MKKLFFYFSSIFLVILGMVIDYGRLQMRSVSGSTGTLLLAIWFDIVSSIIFMLLLLILANIALNSKLQIMTKVLFFIFGLIFTFLPIIQPPLSPIFSTFPPKMIEAVVSFRVYTSLAGAFLLIVSIISSFKNIQKA